MELMDEQIEKVALDFVKKPGMHGYIEVGDLIDFARALLAAHSAEVQEPVAEVESWTNGSYHRNYKLRWLKDVEAGAKLYAHPQPMPQTDAARDALDDIIAARKAMLKRVDDVHIADRQTGCSTVYDHELERSKALLFRAIDAEIERLDRSKGE